MPKDKTPQNVYDRLFRYAEILGFGDLHLKIDHDQGLFAIVAIHSTKLGPALGGCRCIPYASVEEALKDSLRLARMMSYKAAIHNLPHGGAKAVLMKPKEIHNREQYFNAFGQFINELNGRYITAIDSGTSPSDMDLIAKQTAYVTCTSEQTQLFGDTSDFTALGVCRAIEAAVKFRLDKNDLDGIHIAVQGAGNVGYHLIKYLKKQNAKITVCDINAKNLQRCVDEFGVNTVDIDSIYDIDCDVFAPCALGEVLNANTIKRLKCSIVAGSANNQLAHVHHGSMLLERGILYAPDFVINAGGLIQVCTLYDNKNHSIVVEKVNGIYETTLNLLQQAAQSNLAAHNLAEQIAQERLETKPKDSIAYEEDCNV